MRRFAIQWVAYGAASMVWLPAVAGAQPVAVVASPADKTDTNPANLQTRVDFSDRFDSVDDQLFLDEVTWNYAQAFAGRRMRAHAALPLAFGNLTGRVEAGFGDVGAGWEWLAAVKGQLAILAGVDVTFDTSSNDALAIGHHTAAPLVGLVVVPRDDTVISLRYDQRLSLNRVEGRPDVDKGTLEGAVVRRFSERWWLRAVASLDVDVEQGDTWGTLRGEWGRLLFNGFSTWVRSGGGLGTARPMNWTVELGFRVVP